jgi:hypothetical protein
MRIVHLLVKPLFGPRRVPKLVERSISRLVTVVVLHERDAVGVEVGGDSVLDPGFVRYYLGEHLLEFNRVGFLEDVHVGVAVSSDGHPVSIGSGLHHPLASLVEIILIFFDNV